MNNWQLNLNFNVYEHMHDEDLFEQLPCVDLKGVIVLNLRVSNINKVIYRFKFNSNLSKNIIL